MSKNYEKESYFHRIRSKSGNPGKLPRHARPHPELYPYIATEMGRDVWDIQAIREDDLEAMESRTRDRVWRSRGVCYLVLSDEKTVHFSPTFQTGTLTERPRGGWILRVSAEEGVDEARQAEVARLSETMADQLKDQGAPRMELEEPGRGVELLYFSLVVKMSSITGCREWTWTGFLDFCQENDLTPVTDGQLVVFSAMSGGELGLLADALEERGLQCQEYPVDYYLIDVGDHSLIFGNDAFPQEFFGRRFEHEVIRTPHDHEISVSLRSVGGFWARLEGGLA